MTTPTLPDIEARLDLDYILVNTDFQDVLAAFDDIRWLVGEVRRLEEVCRSAHNQIALLTAELLHERDALRFERDGLKARVEQLKEARYGKTQEAT